MTSVLAIAACTGCEGVAAGWGADADVLDVVVRPNDCATPPSYGHASLTGAAARTAGPLNAPVHVEVSGLLLGGARFSVELVAGRGVFSAGPIKAGTYALAGVEQSQTTCGLCVRIARDGAESYHATSGQVTVTQVLPRIVGTVSSVTFVEALVAPNGDTVFVDAGCRTRIDQLSFDELVEDLGGG